jgi:hypothetical protein
MANILSQVNMSVNSLDSVSSDSLAKLANNSSVEMSEYIEEKHSAKDL